MAKQAAKIAIIEDDIPIAAMYDFKLQQAGYDVRLAHDGQAGLALAKAFSPDLMLLDLRMPLLNGDEVLEELRTTVWGSHIRVIILTNISRNEAPAKLRFLNVDRYIVKAHNTPQQVLDIVKEVLK